MFNLDKVQKVSFLFLGIATDRTILLLCCTRQNNFDWNKGVTCSCQKNNSLNHKQIKIGYQRNLLLSQIMEIFGMF